MVKAFSYQDARLCVRGGISLIGLSPVKGVRCPGDSLTVPSPPSRAGTGEKTGLEIIKSIPQGLEGAGNFFTETDLTRASRFRKGDDPGPGILAAHSGAMPAMVGLPLYAAVACV